MSTVKDNGTDAKILPVFAFNIFTVFFAGAVSNDVKQAILLKLLIADIRTKVIFFFISGGLIVIMIPAICLFRTFQLIAETDVIHFYRQILKASLAVITVFFRLLFITQFRIFHL